MFAQKLVVELTKLTIGDERETPDHKEPDENEDSAFMPGELNDVMNGEDNERSSGIEESHKI